MKHLSSVLLCLLASQALAQDTPAQQEIQFLQRLRADGYRNLAEDYLQRLAQTGPPEIKAELPLELAITRLEKAQDEPDAGKRAAVYRQAKSDFRGFLNANGNHPRADDARLFMASVSMLQGRSLLSKALADPATTRVVTPELQEARRAFQEADREIKEAVDRVEQALAPWKNKQPNSPDEKSLKARLIQNQIKSLFDYGLNTYYLALTYPRAAGDNAIALERADRIRDAIDRFNAVSGKDGQNPLCWDARAWSARCLVEIGKAREARTKYEEIRKQGANEPAAGEAIRLARYFDLLTVQDSPDLLGQRAAAMRYLDTEARAWIARYPRSLKTPEGYGIRYLLAELVLEKAENPSADDLALGRNLIRDIEHGENDFSDRARQLKIRLFIKQGKIKREIKDLDSFDDCYVRAQYEAEQMGLANDEWNQARQKLQSLTKGKPEAELAQNKAAIDAKKKEVEEKEKKRQKALDTLLAALVRGLDTAEAKGKSPPPEVPNAQAMLTYFFIETKKYPEAIQLGRSLADNNPQAAPASLAAAYVLDAYLRQLAELQAAKEPARDKIEALRTQIFEWAKSIEQRWPQDAAADVARDQLARTLLVQKKLIEAIDMLGRIRPTFPEYGRVQYQIYETAQQAEQQGLKRPGRDDPKAWQDLGLEALRRIPDHTGAHEEFMMANHVYLLSRIIVAQDALRRGQYDEVDRLARDVQVKMAQNPPLPFSPDQAQDDRVREYLKSTGTDLRLRVLYAKVQEPFKSNAYAKVAEILDPWVKEVNEGKWPDLKSSMVVGDPLLKMALRSDLLTNHLVEARGVVKALKDNADDAGDKTADTFRLLATLSRQLIAEVRQGTDKELLGRTTTGLTELLSDAQKELTKENTERSPTVAIALAQAYSALEQHGKASDLLTTIKEPKPDAADDLRNYRTARLLLAREYRLLKEPAKAKAIMDEILVGKNGAKGWGANSLEVRKEWVALLELQEDWSESVRQSNTMMLQLAKQLSDPKRKEEYLECNYHLVLGLVRHARKNLKDDAAKYTKSINDAARSLVQLEKDMKGFGSPESTKRFQDLLKEESDLRAAYERMKK